MGERGAARGGMLRIVTASSLEQIDAARTLFREYAAWLDVDLCFQGFEQELAELPGEYQVPSGRLLLAYYGEKLAGCAALRGFEGGVCEMKRLFVRAEFRALGIGKALATAIIEEARRAGYSEMRLDTLSVMKEARSLYSSLGFQEMPPYRYNPIQGAVYMRLSLKTKAL